MDFYDLLDREIALYDKKYDEHNGDLCSMYADLENEINRIEALPLREFASSPLTLDENFMPLAHVHDRAASYLAYRFMRESGWSKGSKGMWVETPDEEMIDLIMKALVLEGSEATAQSRDTIQWMLSQKEYRYQFLKYFVRKSNELEEKNKESGSE